MALRDIYEDLRLGRGMFSPITPFRQERKMARLVAPAITRAMGVSEAATTRSIGDVAGAAIRGKSAVEAQRVGEAGAMARQSLITDTQKLLRGLMERGLMKRKRIDLRGKKLDIAGLMDRLKFAEGEHTKRLGEDIKSREAMTREGILEERRVSDLISSRSPYTETYTGGGTVSDILSEPQGFDQPASPVRNPYIDNLYENEEEELLLFD